VRRKDMSDNGEEPYDLSQEKIELDDFIIHHKKGKKYLQMHYILALQ
jgi:hypothetical protein